MKFCSCLNLLNLLNALWPEEGKWAVARATLATPCACPWWIHLWHEIQRLAIQYQWRLSKATYEVDIKIGLPLITQLHSRPFFFIFGTQPIWGKDSHHCTFIFSISELMLFVIDFLYFWTDVICYWLRFRTYLGLPFYWSDEGQVGLEKAPLFKVGNDRKSLGTTALL